MKTVKISSFLKERKIKLKPQAANCSGLQRIEKIDFSGKIYLSPVQTNTDMILIKSGDLVISGINVEKGALAIYTSEEDVLASIHYSAYEFDAEKIDIDYLKWFLKSNIFRKLLLKQTESGIKKEIKAKHLLPIEIQLPSLNWQHEIVRQIQGVANYIEEVNRQIQQQAEYAEMLRQSILQQAVEGKLCEQDPNDEPASVLLKKIKAEKERLIAEKKIKKQKPLPPISEEEKPFALPKGWEWCRLPEIGELSRGKSKHRPRNDATLYKDGKYPLVQTGDVARAGTFITTYTALYNDVGLAQSRMWEKGTLCITIAANIADTGILSFDACFPDSVVGFQPFVPELDVEFFKWYIDMSKKNLEKYAPATAQKNINIDILSGLIVPLPPKNELKKITRKAKNILALCDSLSHELLQSKQYASQLMESVLQEAFSVQETAKPAQVIEFHPDQTTPETELLAVARGKIREDTWEHLCKRALEIVGEES